MFKFISDHISIKYFFIGVLVSMFTCTLPIPVPLQFLTGIAIIVILGVIIGVISITDEE